MAATIVFVVGLILGFRPDAGLDGVVLGIALLLLFSFSLSWLWTMLALLLRTEKAVMNVSMMVLFPLTFASNIFVDPDTMPRGVQAFVDINPISHLVTAERGLIHGGADGGDIALVLIACGVLLAVFGPLTMHLYRTKQ